MHFPWKFIDSMWHKVACNHPRGELFLQCLILCKLFLKHPYLQLASNQLESLKHTCNLASALVRCTTDSNAPATVKGLREKMHKEKSTKYTQKPATQEEAGTDVAKDLARSLISLVSNANADDDAQQSKAKDIIATLTRLGGL